MWQSLPPPPPPRPQGPPLTERRQLRDYKGLDSDRQALQLVPGNQDYVQLGEDTRLAWPQQHAPARQPLQPLQQQQQQQQRRVAPVMLPPPLLHWEEFQVANGMLTKAEKKATKAAKAEKKVVQAELLQLVRDRHTYTVPPPPPPQRQQQQQQQRPPPQHRSMQWHRPLPPTQQQQQQQQQQQALQVVPQHAPQPQRVVLRDLVLVFDADHRPRYSLPGGINRGAAAAAPAFASPSSACVDPTVDSTAAPAAAAAAPPLVLEDDEGVLSIIKMLPARLAQHLRRYTHNGLAGAAQLREVVIDVGRNVELRLGDGSSCQLPGVRVDILDALQRLGEVRDEGAEEGDGGGRGWKRPRTAQDASPSTESCGVVFDSNHRLALPGSLHRISCLRNRHGICTGLTYRLGRHIQGAAAPLEDVLQQIARKDGCSLLLVGRPGLGKTTLLRDIARTLADVHRLGAAVVVIDTSNEIAGDSDVAHWCIGRARRMMVPRRSMQHAVLLEALQNATPEVIILDEICTKQEVDTIRTIARRGVRVIGTVHGSDLSSVMANPELNGLVGGIQAVTLGDRAAAERGITGKVTHERCGAPPFDMLLEVLSQTEWRLHPRLAESVDIMLRAGPPTLKDKGEAALPPQPGQRPGGGRPPREQPHSQVRRCEAAPGPERLRVRFETAEAARRAGALNLLLHTAA